MSCRKVKYESDRHSLYVIGYSFSYDNKDVRIKDIPNVTAFLSCAACSMRPQKTFFGNIASVQSNMNFLYSVSEGESIKVPPSSSSHE